MTGDPPVEIHTKKLKTELHLKLTLDIISDF